MPKVKATAKQRKEHDREVTCDLLRIASSVKTKLEKEVISDAESLSLFHENELKKPSMKTHRKTPKRAPQENSVKSLAVIKEELDSGSEFPSNQLSGHVVGQFLSPLKFTSVNAKTNDTGSADDTSDSQDDLDSVPSGRLSPAADIGSEEEPMSPVISSQSSNLGRVVNYFHSHLADEVVISPKRAKSDRRKSPRKATGVVTSTDSKTFLSPDGGKLKITSPLNISQGSIQKDRTADNMLSPRRIKAENTLTASPSQNHTSGKKQLQISEFLSPIRKTATIKRKALTGSLDQDIGLQRKSDTEPSDEESVNDIMEPDEGENATEFDCCKTVKFKCPENFKPFMFSGKDVCLEDVDTEDTEFWLIKAPADYDIEQLSGTTVVLDGVQTLPRKHSTGDQIEGYEIQSMRMEEPQLQLSRTTRLSYRDKIDKSYIEPAVVNKQDIKHRSNLMSNYMVMLPSRTQGRLVPGPVFSGQMNIMLNLTSPKFVDIPIPPVKERTLSPSLIPRYVPFGADDPGKYMRLKSKKKKKRHTEDFHEKEFIDDSLTLPIKHKHKQKHHRHDRHSRLESLDAASDSMLVDGQAELASSKKKKKKKHSTRS